MHAYFNNVISYRKYPVLKIMNCYMKERKASGCRKNSGKRGKTVPFSRKFDKNFRH